MADPVVETPVVEAPPAVVQVNPEDSFKDWKPGQVNAETPPAVADPPKDAETTDTPHAEAPNPMADFLKGFGDFKDPDEFKAHYGTTAAQNKELQEKVAALEAKQLDYGSDALAQLDAYQRELVAAGETDPKVISRKLREFWDENSTDWNEVAKSTPAQVIEKSLRAKYGAMGLPQGDIDRAVRKETMLPPKPKLEDYGNDATDADYLSALETYEDAESTMRMKALQLAQEIEAGKKKIDFQPKGVQTPAERQARIDKAVETYNSRVKELEKALPGIEFAGQKLDFPIEGRYMEEINSAILDPHKWLSQFYLEDGTPDPVAIGTMQSKLSASPMMIERAVKQAVHKQTEEQDKALHNPNLTTLPPNGGGSGQKTPEDAFKDWAALQGRT